MFGLFSSKKHDREFVNTPDGPGVVMGMKDNIYRVKLKKARGRPRHYQADQISPVENELIVEGVSLAAKLAVSQVNDTAAAATGYGVKKGVSYFFKWRARSKTGY